MYNIETKPLSAREKKKKILAEKELEWSNMLVYILAMNDRLKFLETLLNEVESGKLAAVVAAAQAGLVEPHEDALGEEAALFRLQWEVEFLQI
jgi:hypothetical protein